MNRERLRWVLTGLEYDRLTDWESKFVENVEEYFKKHGDLTDKQEEVLERIFKEKSR